MSQMLYRINIPEGETFISYSTSKISPSWAVQNFCSWVLLVSEQRFCVLKDLPQLHSHTWKEM